MQYMHTMHVCLRLPGIRTSVRNRNNRQKGGEALKNYLAIEAGVLAFITAVLMGIPDLGGIWPVAPLMALGWTTLQLVSAVAWCKAIHKGDVIVYHGQVCGRETYGFSKTAKPGWLVKRHVWVYNLISVPQANSPAPASQR